MVVAAVLDGDGSIFWARGCTARKKFVRRCFLAAVGKDAHDREAILASLREQLKQGDKSLVGNRGYRKYLWPTKSHFEIDETIRGHVFCSFLALLLRKELQDRLEARGENLSWNDVIADLERLQYADVQQDGKRFLLRSEAQGTCSKAFAAAGVALPPTVQQSEAP